MSVYEYYWAPITKDKVKYTTNLLFLIQAGLHPFKYLAANVSAITKANEQSGSSADKGDTAGRIFLREVFRQALLFLPLILLFGWLLYSLADFGSWSSLVALKQPAAILTLVLAGIRYLYIYTNLRALRAPKWRAGGLEESPWWKALLVVGILFHLFYWPFGLIPTLHLVAYAGTRLAGSLPFLKSFAETNHLHWSRPLNWYAVGYLTRPSGHSFWNTMGAWFFLSTKVWEHVRLLIALLLAAVVRHILIDYVGDVAVYANPNELSQNFSARAQVLDGCVRALAGILSELDEAGRPRFDRVLLAGHSLGSIIAYDSMNQLLNLARINSSGAKIASSGAPVAGGIGPDHLRRIRGLVTFGCPLNKIYYFFRELDDPGATLRHRTLDLVHSFRLKSSLATNLPPVFAEVGNWCKAKEALAESFVWINAYSLLDPVSGRLMFYNVGREVGDGNFPDLDAQQRFEYKQFGFAHSKYWSDPEFYRFIVGKLL